MNNEFGAAYDGGFREWLKKTPLKDSVKDKRFYENAARFFRIG